MASDVAINDVTEKVKEYAELSKTIKITQEKLKILNKKKKELYKEVVPKLKTSNVTKCNLSFGILKVVKKKTKISPTKMTMKEKYISFFNTRALDQDFINGTAEIKSTILFKSGINGNALSSLLLVEPKIVSIKLVINFLA